VQGQENGSLEGNVIHLIGGEKGGVGKSLMARLLIHYIKERGLPFRAFDADRSNAALLRYYPKVSTQILTDRHDHLDKIIETAHETPGGRIIVDLAAQTHDLLVKWMEGVEMIDMVGSMDYRVCYWHVMDCGKDSVDLLRRLFDRFGSKLGYVIVQNQLRGENFDLFEKSAEKSRAMELGAKVVSIRHLMSHVMHKIDASNAPFGIGRHPERDNTRLGLVDRQRLKLWLTHACAQMDQVHI
jgi:CO dehydrogenase nickel-insertion accessory protein CooC1